MAFSAPFTGYVTLLPGQARSGSSSASVAVDNAQGFNTIDCQVLTDQTWTTTNDGRHVVFTASCSTDGGATFPWSVGPFIFTPPGDLGKRGSPEFSFSIPVNVNHFQASYSVLDVNGSSGPSINFGVAMQGAINA